MNPFSEIGTGTKGHQLDRTRVRSEFDRDFAAMKRVWRMIRDGTVRMVGEIGRQY